MKYIVEFRLADKTRMQGIVFSSNKEAAKIKCLQIYRRLREKQVITGRKFSLDNNSVLSVEKWSGESKTMGNGSLRPYTLIAVDAMGQDVTVNLKSPGFKTAYKQFMQPIGEVPGITVFTYDNSQKTKLKSSTHEAKKVLQDRTLTTQTLQKACEKSKEIGNVDSSRFDVVEDIPLLCSLIYDYCKGEYTEVLLRTIIGATAAILYFVSPIDLIPDFIPGVGQLDDVAIIAYALKCVHTDLMEYKQWKMEQRTVEGKPNT